MTEEQILHAYRLCISRNPRQNHHARQNVYYSLKQLYGQGWLSKHSDRIKRRLDEIEKEITQGVVYEP
jgi:hypothetical protein